MLNFGIKLVGEEVAERKFLGGNGRAADLVESQLSFSDDVGGGKLSKVGVLANNFGSDDEATQVGFFLDDFGVILGANGGVGGVDEREKIHVTYFFEVAGFAEFLFDGEIVNGRAGRVEFQNGFENELVFGTVKVVGVDNGEDFRNDGTFVQEHGREKLFLHFDSVREVVVFKHSNHLVELEGKEKTTLTKVNAVFENASNKKSLQKISLWDKMAEIFFTEIS